MAVVACCPMRATTGWWSMAASYKPFSRWMAPGPEVARQTPTSPVNSLLKGSVEIGRGIVADQGPGCRGVAVFVRLAAGERFGIIRFGSRLDVYLPQGAVPLVAVGQTAIAGETVLADTTLATPHHV